MISTGDKIVWVCNYLVINPAPRWRHLMRRIVWCLRNRRIRQPKPIRTITIEP